jgi:hypothetical protein
VLRTQGVIDAFNNPASATFGYRFNNPRRTPTRSALRCSRMRLLGQDQDRRARREGFAVSCVNMAGGPAALALGGEWRKTYVNTPSLSGTENGSVFANYNGGYTQDEDVWALYAELLMPVVKNLELSAAVRYDHYDKFDSTTPKIAAKWTPIQQLRAARLVRGRLPGTERSGVEPGPPGRLRLRGCLRPGPLPQRRGPPAGRDRRGLHRRQRRRRGQRNPDLQAGGVEELQLRLHRRAGQEPHLRRRLVEDQEEELDPDDFHPGGFLRPDGRASDNNLVDANGEHHPELRQRARGIRAVREQG